DLELACHPFPHCIIRNFIGEDGFIDDLQKELLGLNFNEKSNDLYKFKQSVLFQQFRPWLEGMIGAELESTVDISCAKYEYTVLLCHDDELEGRRVAFILYLVPQWDSSDGGTLDLYKTDISKTIVPTRNTLVIFEVSPVSFHQVSEVLSKEKCRLSLGGWFHGQSLERPPRYIEPPVTRNPHIPRDETLLMEWVNPVYLDISYQEHIQGEFEDSSEIQLKDFLKDKFRQVNEALQLSQIQWTKKGPANKCYDVASLENLPECIYGCWELLHSEAFFLLLSNFTGLRLHYLCPSDDDDDEEQKTKENVKQDEEGTSAEETTSNNNRSAESTPKCSGELRRWTHGSYTLLHDGEAARAEYALDWDTDFGGFTCYVANEEDEELLTVYPEDNSLALVYRDKETLKFVKHINHKSSQPSTDSSRGRTFYDFSIVYYE
uniref:Prolyl 3-hydroxylase OGFOD1 n=1 Tax=Periophthalmus magnuspinnatus TaxID=409849 RepID=A0A3B3ZEL1_9GOBI